MSVATPVQPDVTSQTASVYKTAIDAAIAVASRSGWWFAPHEQSTPDMTLRLDAGFVWTSAGGVEVAAQSTGTITAPSSNPRKDLVVVDAGDGAVSVITGAENASPTVPALTAGKIPIAVITLATDTTAIDNALVTDARDWGLAPATTAEMQAGTETELRAMAPADVAASIAALTVSADLVARNGVIVNAWDIAVLDGMVARGLVGTIIDVFSDASGVDATASTGETYDASNDRYSNGGTAPTTDYGNTDGTGNRTGSITVTASGTAAAGGTADNLVDGSFSADSGGSWDFGGSPLAISASEYFTFQFGEAKYIDEVKVYWSSGSMGTWKMQYSTDDATYTDCSDPTAITSASTTIAMTPPATGGAYYRLTGVSGSENNNYLQEVEFKIATAASPESFVLESVDFTAASTPEELRLLVEIEDVDETIEIGTDLDLLVSRDGGTTFTGGTETVVSAGPGGLKVIALTVDVTGQPSGTDCRWRITCNGEPVRVNKIALQADVTLTIEEA